MSDPKTHTTTTKVVTETPSVETEKVTETEKETTVVTESDGNPVSPGNGDSNKDEG